MKHISNFDGFVNELYDSPDVPKLKYGEEYNLATGLFKKKVDVNPIVDQHSGALKLLDKPLTARLPFLKGFECRNVDNDIIVYSKDYSYGIVSFFNGMEEETHYTQSVVRNPTQKEYMIVTTKEGFEWDILEEDMRLCEDLFHLNITLTITQAHNAYDVSFNADFSNVSSKIDQHEDFSVDLPGLAYQDVTRRAAAQVGKRYQALQDYCDEQFEINL